MQTVNQLSNRTLFYLLVGVVAICLVWWAGPRIYVPATQLLPDELVSHTNPSEAEAAKQIARLEARISQLQTENRSLRVSASSEEVDVATSTLPESFQSARVLARPPQTAYDVLLVDVGKQQGVTAGAVVWWPPGVYLGDVVEVRAGSSLVRLVSSPDVRHAGRVGTNITTITQGRGGGALSATVPASANIATGTLAVSDRWGVPFARVVSSEPAAALAKQRLFFQPIIPASVIENVYVGQ